MELKVTLVGRLTTATRNQRAELITVEIFGRSTGLPIAKKATIPE